MAALLPSTRPALRLVMATLLAAGATACGTRETSTDSTSEHGGTLIVVQPAEPSTLFPPLAEGAQGGAVVSAIFDKLADIGPRLETYGDQGFQPRLARSWAWAADSLSVAFTLDSAARWHDGTPVTANDVRFSFAVYTADSVASPFRTYLGNIDSVTVRDPRTAVFWFKRRTPQQFYDATYNMFVLPSHALDTIPMSQLGASAFARAPIGTGRFRFVRWDAGQRIEVVADTANSRGRAKLDRVVWSFAPDFGAATVKLFAGEADFFEMIRPDNLAQIARTPTLRLVDNHALAYSFLAFNFRDPASLGQPHPIFGDSLVRRALAMAVDRERVVRNVFDSLGTVALAPAPRALIPDTAAITQIGFDAAAARALLDSAGWRDSDGDGVRDRNGRPLAFDVLVPSSSATRLRAAVLLQEQFRDVGVKATPLPVDVNAFTEATDAHHFDAYIGGWATQPGLAGIRQTWMSAGEGNEGRYSSAVFDANADSAYRTFDVTRMRTYWTRAFQQAVNDVPAIWLYEARSPVAVHKRFIVPPLRADGWYADLAEWRVDPAQRLDRDRIGLGSATGAKR